MWADKVKGVTQPSQKGKKNTSNKGTKGEAQPEHRVDPRIQSLEAENRQLRRKLAELEEALNSIRGQVTNREEASTNNPGPLAGQPKRKAPNPDPLSDTEEEEEMTEDCETPSTTLAPPAQNEGKWEKTLSRMMEMLSAIESRVTLLERPRAQPKSRQVVQTEASLATPNPDGGAKGF